MKEEYLGFWPTLEAGIKKIASYYEKTTDSDAYMYYGNAYVDIILTGSYQLTSYSG